MITAMALNNTLKTSYTPEDILAMDDEHALMLREGISVLGNFIEWERKKAKYYK